MVLLGLYSFPYQENGISESFFRIYLSGYAQVVAGVLSRIDPTLLVMGNVLMGQFSMVIIKTCDAMEVNILLISAVAAFPAPLVRKVLVLPATLSLVVSTNVIRLILLYLAGMYFPSAFEALHFDVFPLLMVVAGVLIFLFSIRLLSPSVHEPKGVPHAP